jgi:hypothetical protein
MALLDLREPSLLGSLVLQALGLGASIPYRQLRRVKGAVGIPLCRLGGRDPRMGGHDGRVLLVAREETAAGAAVVAIGHGGVGGRHGAVAVEEAAAALG